MKLKSESGAKNHEIKTNISEWKDVWINGIKDKLGEEEEMSENPPPQVKHEIFNYSLCLDFFVLSILP